MGGEGENGRRWQEQEIDVELGYLSLYAERASDASVRNLEAALPPTAHADGDGGMSSRNVVLISKSPETV